MKLNKSIGNMFGFVSHNHTHLGGECSHKCSYCYVMHSSHGVIPKYSGHLRLLRQELEMDYGTGKSIFIEHCNDLFAANVPREWILEILSHCSRFPGNTYLFHTKNPGRYLEFLNELPPNRILGATLESNRHYPSISTAPCPANRVEAMSMIQGRKLITIEPIMDFDLDALVDSIARIKPEIVAIGADSKGRGLQEPSRKQIVDLVVKLSQTGIKVKQKSNLGRLLIR